MALHVLAYNLTWATNILGVKPLIAAIQAAKLQHHCLHEAPYQCVMPRGQPLPSHVSYVPGVIAFPHMEGRRLPSEIAGGGLKASGAHSRPPPCGARA
jgi:hypothetical protein